ncbi:MAG TPA: SIMPL domain-containing protein [Verrucomicrobiota bacterium]|nr:SIMPL domain-containing protein [Verrucomicrobiota bacterium]
MADVDRQPWYGVAAILSLGLVVSALIGGQALEKMRSATDGVTVKGVAETEITADLATWRGQITVRAKDPVDGYDKIQLNFTTAINFLLQQGVPSDAIEEGTINASTHYKRDAKGHATSEIESHTLSQTFTVTTTDVALAKRLAKESTQLIRNGIAFSSHSPSFYYTKLEDLKLDLLERAANNAQLRAERLAKSSGNRVANIISASQGIFQITQPNSTETASWGMYDTSTIEKKVRAVVTMRYRTE